MSETTLQCHQHRIGLLEESWHRLGWVTTYGYGILFQSVLLNELVQPNLFATIAYKYPLHFRHVLQFHHHLCHLVKALGTSQITGNHDLKALRQLRNLHVFLALAHIHTPVRIVNNLLVIIALLTNGSTEWLTCNQNLVTTVVNTLHQTIHPVQDMLILDSPPRHHRIGPQIHNPVIEWNLLHPPQQQSRIGLKDRRRLMTNDAVILLPSQVEQHPQQAKYHKREIVDR